MKVGPILFTAPMVRALLREAEQPGTGKTQTRRIQKLPKQPSLRGDWKAGTIGGGGVTDSKDRPFPETACVWHTGTGLTVIPKWKKGDLLWVKENHRLTECECTEACRGPGHVWYDADASGYRNVAHNRCRPSIFMPRWASRLTLQVTDVRVQRVQDISCEDALAEGIAWSERSSGYSYDQNDGGPGYHSSDPRKSYQVLWGLINGDEAWDANPWIVALTFTVHKINVDELLKQREAA